MLRRLIMFWLVTAFCALAGAGVAQAGQPASQLAREVQAVLNVAIGDRSEFFATPEATCRLDTAWLPNAAAGESHSIDISVPDDLARKYLGDRRHKQTAGPVAGLSLKEALDPKGEYGFAFCTNEEFDRYKKEHSERVESKGEPDYEMFRNGFSFPVFDNRFQTAILLAVVESSHVKGKTIWKSFVNCFAEVYKKRGAVWRGVESVQLCIT